MEFGYNSTVCYNLDDYPEVQDTVQKRVSDYMAYAVYFDLVSTFAALWLGKAVSVMQLNFLNFTRRVLFLIL